MGKRLEEQVQGPNFFPQTKLIFVRHFKNSQICIRSHLPGSKIDLKSHLQTFYEMQQQITVIKVISDYFPKVILLLL